MAPPANSLNLDVTLIDDSTLGAAQPQPKPKPKPQQVGPSSDAASSSSSSSDESDSDSVALPPERPLVQGKRKGKGKGKGKGTKRAKNYGLTTINLILEPPAETRKDGVAGRGLRMIT